MSNQLWWNYSIEELEQMADEDGNITKESIKKFDEEIRHRRKDLNEYYQNILKTEITVRQYQNAYSLISQLKNQKQMRKFRQYMTELLSEPAKN